MATFNEVFKREEIKYCVKKEQLKGLLAGLTRHMEVDEYGKTLISSMYWDTRQRDLIARSIEKPLYKEKLRLRRYGSTMALDAEPCFIELKKKFKGVVYKRRVKTTGLAAALFLDGSDYERACTSFPLKTSRAGFAAESKEEFAPRSLQIAEEIAAFRDRHELLRPSVLIECQRTAWRLRHGSSDAASELRITVDRGLSYQDLMASGDAKKTRLVVDDEAVLEIKAVNALPAWLVALLNANRIRPASFTKYGRAYQSIMVAA